MKNKTKQENADLKLIAIHDLKRSIEAKYIHEKKNDEPLFKRLR